MSDSPEASNPVPSPTPAPAAAATVVLPPENATRGTLLALLIIPAGIIVFVILGAIGFISGWTALAVAIGAMALYRFGSGGRISINGAVRISIISIITVIVSFIGTYVAGNAAYFSRALQSGKFFEGLAATMSRGGGDTTINVLLVTVFTIIGVVLVFRTAITQAKTQPPARTVPPQV